MLQSLREKTSGWFATIILSVLIVPFAFFGLEQYGSHALANQVAVLRAPPKWWPSAPGWWPASMFWQREEIGSDEFRNAFDRIREQQIQIQGGDFDARAFESAENKRAALEQMIDQRVMRMAAKRDGLAISDVQLRAAIERIPAFQANGKFDPQAYQYALVAQRQTPRQFEQVLYDGLLQGLIPQAVGSSSFITKGELERLMRLLAETRDIGYVTMPPPPRDTSPVGDVDIRMWYDSHRDLYRAPESVTLEYIEVDDGALPAPAAPDEAVLRKRYQEQIEKFGSGEQREVAHILVKVDGDAGARKAAEQKAADLARQARASGADFAALARAHSDDSGSKANGGELGWIERDGAMVKPFEDAVFSLQAGQVSDPVSSDFGYHVILVRSIKPGQRKSFEQARAELLAEQSKLDRERAFNDLVGKLVDEAAKNPNSLVGAAQVGKLQVRTVQRLARTPSPAQLASDPVVAHSNVLRAAFSDSLIQEGTVSDPIQIEPGRSVLIRVAGHQPERALPLAQVRDRVIEAIRTDRTAKAAQAEADKVLAEVGSGKMTLAAVAAARKWPHAERTGVQRGFPLPDLETSEAMFAVPAPTSGKPSLGKRALPDGGVVLFSVGKVTPGDIAKIGAEQRSALQQQFERAIGYEEETALLRALRARVELDVTEEPL